MEQDKHIMRVRCISRRGCHHDNFFYEFNEEFTTRIVVDEKNRRFKERLSKLGRKKSDLSTVELCQLSVPEHLQVLRPGRAEELPKSIPDQMHWPKPGQDALNPRPLFVEIQHAGQMLDHRKNHHWREDGKPSEVVIGSLLNKPITQEQVDAALPNLRRREIAA